MPRYEVHIPGAEPGAMSVTLRVDAPNWMQALKTGFFKLGEAGLVVHNVLVDVADDGSLHVTEGGSGRVFRIRELSDAEAESAKVKAPAPARLDPSAAQTVRVVPAQAGGPAAAPAGALEPTLVTPRPAPDRPLGRAAPRPTPLSTPALVLPTAQELVEPTRPVRGPIGRARPPPPPREMEDVLADVFDRVQGVYQFREPGQGLYYLLDLALEKIPVEGGSVFSCELITGTLRFVAVRGPKAKEILASRVVIPAGKGIVGFCAVEGVSLALSDVQKDRRWYSGVDERFDFDTRSVLCSPMVSAGRTYGCLELVNRKPSPMFTDNELGLLSYIAHQGALFLHTLG
ncbi:MAG TPA: GAF domain-containing protein [Myxococcaceae bacterium]|nr:GAF domain-containing protein [Myxococcaceae bacterium]